jgi:hypothetical protein
MGIDLVDSYQEICDALLKLKAPVSYRKAKPFSEEGYPIEPAVLQKILDAAKKPEFADVVCRSVSSYKVVSHDEAGNPIQDLAYDSITVEFNKKPKAL